MDTLCKLCQRSGALIRPYIAEVVATLVEALSALEPQVLSYLTFHVDKLDVSADQVGAERRGRRAVVLGAPRTRR